MKSIIENSRVVMNKSDNWSEQMAFYRFFSNDNVKEETLINCAENHYATNCAGKKHLLLVGDTTEFNMEKHRKRISSKAKLGLVGNNSDLGFLCHTTLAVDTSDALPIGITDLHLWHREEDKLDKNERNYKKLPFEEKESWRWVGCAIDSRKRLPDVETVTAVYDREGDIYEGFCLLREAGVDWVIRVAQDRLIKDCAPEEGGARKLFEKTNKLSVAGEYEIKITSDNKKRSKRNAILQVSYGTIEICRPAKIVEKNKYPETISVQVVHVKEKADSVPKGEEPIEWLLYTSHPVNSFADARQIIYYYQLRWLIEDLYRTAKSEGVNYESSELESGAALRKLLVMALMASVQILQLRQARDGKTNLAPSQVFSEEQLTCMEEILPRFEGKTQKQKNPYSRDNLGWVTWLIARLGGWKGYASQRPPGVIIIREGWIRFNNMFEGWKIARRE